MQIEDYGDQTILSTSPGIYAYNSFVTQTFVGHIPLENLQLMDLVFDAVDYSRHGVKIGWLVRYGNHWIRGGVVP